MLKLEDIANAVYFEFRRAQLDAMKTERLGSIHVSDLIKPCMRNVIYSKVEPRSGTTTEDMRSLYFGQCVHSNSQLATEENHEKFLAYDYVRDEALTREESLKIPDEDPRQLDIIYGSIDDLLKIDGKWVITDKKTTGSIDYFSRATAKACDSHKDQINRSVIGFDINQNRINNCYEFQETPTMLLLKCWRDNKLTNVQIEIEEERKKQKYFGVSLSI